MEKEKQSGEALMEGSNVYHDFLPLISGESGTIMICQRSVWSHSTGVLPTILRDLGRKSPKSLRTEYVSAFMVTCLGLIIAISLGYFTREDVLAVQIQEIR